MKKKRKMLYHRYPKYAERLGKHRINWRQKKIRRKNLQTMMMIKMKQMKRKSRLNGQKRKPQSPVNRCKKYRNPKPLTAKMNRSLTKLSLSHPSRVRWDVEHKTMILSQHRNSWFSRDILFCLKRLWHTVLFSPQLAAVCVCNMLYTVPI